MLLRRTFRFTLIIAASFVGIMPSISLAREGDRTERYLEEIGQFGAETLVENRLVCALGKMAAIKTQMDNDKDLRRFEAPFPETHVYCLRLITVSQRKGRLFDLYDDIALREQGFNGFKFSNAASLLKSNEAGRTLEAILLAANGDQPSYVGIKGNPHDLPCPLALDAGFTWASSNQSATIPIELTSAEADAITRQCYDPAVTQIGLGGAAVSPQKAGLVMGVWLARHPQ